MSLAVRAPGKAIVCGEYAVLDGAPAISIAVDRWAVARLGEGQRSPFVDAALRHASRALGDPAIAALRVSVDTAAFQADAGKLGIGSSAAVTSAVVGLAFAHAGRALDDRAALFAIADAAHAEAQGVPGSGIDVATSVYGGAIRFERAPGAPPSIRPIAWPEKLVLDFVYSGQSASTADLVGRVRRLRERDGARYATCIGALAAIAHEFAGALERGEADACVAAAGRWTPALDALGHAADAPIVTPFFTTLAELAAQHGLAAKPSGAGGGDLAVTFCSLEKNTLAHWLSRDGYTPVVLTPKGPVRGLSLETA